MNKEVELTAPLDKRQYEKLERYLSKKYARVATLKRFMVRFFKEKVDVRDPADFRYKWTNGVHEVVLKKGALGSKSRQETIINLGAGNQLDSFARFFSMLGFKKMIAVYREIEKFKDNNLEISLITADPYAFVEVEAVDGKSRKKALENVFNFYNEVGMKPLDRAGYQSYLRKLDREVNFAFPLNEFPKPLLTSPRWKKILKSTIFST
jgi:adenylate cyclase class IV